MPDYICKECGKVFTKPSALKQHTLAHTGEMPYQCEVCSRRFAQEMNLTQHMRTHTNTCPFSCQVCGMSFTQFAHLRQHKQIAHDKNNLFKCPLCSCRFKLESALSRHRRKAHPSGSTTVHTHTRPVGSDRSPTLRGLSVHTHTESVGMVTVTTQTNVSSGNTISISTVTSPIGSAYVVHQYSSSATITTAIQASGLVTTNTDPNLPGSGSGSIPENASTAELSNMHDYDTDDSSDDIDVVN